jgi:hypothetical protein
MAQDRGGIHTVGAFGGGDVVPPPQARRGKLFLPLGPHLALRINLKLVAAGAAALLLWALIALAVYWSI